MQDRQTVLTDSDWKYIKPIVDNGRKRKTCLRMVVDAIRYITRTGTQWRNIYSLYRAHLPIIQYYFYRWRAEGTWGRVLSALVGAYREAAGCPPKPSRVALDSQSVKSPPFVSEERGIDGNKRINGRKRHIAVDKHGLPVAVAVTAANMNDGKAGLEILWQLDGNERLELFCLDKAYEGEFMEALDIYGWKGEIVRGRQVKNRKAVPGSSRRKGAGRSKGASHGWTSTGGFRKITKKPSLSYKSSLSISFWQKSVD